MASYKTVVLNVVALTRDLISVEDTPFLASYLQPQCSKVIEPVFPALTCTAQATYLTGKGPSEHGITANGWYDPVYKEVFNWHQSAGCVKVPRLWHQMKAKCPDATVFVNGWWHGMHDSDIDYFMNVRPQYMHDGAKKPDIYTQPVHLRHELQKKLGTFPLHKFWGPGTGIEASRWIADAALHVDRKHNPTLTLIYLPHMDYCLQKYGPHKQNAHVKSDLKEIDRVVKDLVEYYEGAGARVIILSEYGIRPVSRPVYLNRILREVGYLRIREECKGETLDCGSSPAFALCDHQVAHIHIKNKDQHDKIKELIASVPGVDHVFDQNELNEWYASKGHPKNSAFHSERSGDLVAISDEHSWFAYYYWLNDNMAPDFARCVAIHKKPGYDPAEMLFRYPRPFGFIYLLLKAVLIYVFHIRAIVDATPLSCESIQGSHGRIDDNGDDNFKPILITRHKEYLPSEKLVAENVYEVIWSHLFSS